jgi:hypothetical protein
MKVETTENIDNWIKLFHLYISSADYTVCYAWHHQFVLENIFGLQECTLSFTCIANCVSNRVAPSFIHHIISTFLCPFCWQKHILYDHRIRIQNVWCLVKEKAILGFSVRRSATYSYNITIQYNHNIIVFGG